MLGDRVLETTYGPVYQITPTVYELDGTIFCIHQLEMPHFRAGDTLEEHLSLISLALAHKGIEGYVTDRQGGAD